METTRQMHDFLDEMEDAAGQEAARPVDTRRVEEEVIAALALEEEIAEHEGAISDLKKRLAQIMEQNLPAFMSEIGLTEIGTSDGSRVKLGPRVYATLNKAPDIEAAVAYLEEHGLKGGVLTEATVRFTQEEEEDFRAFLERARSITDKDVLINRGLNASTLRSWVTNHYLENPDFDPAIVGATVSTVAKFTIRGKK